MHDDFPVLLVDDSRHDVLFIKRAWAENGIPNPLITVGNGQECLDYLRGESENGGAGQALRPGLILLDIQMPVMDGIECLAHIRDDADLCTIPVIIFTNSRREEELRRTYALGCNTFMQKPMTYEGLVSLVQIIHNYWSTSNLPLH